jgi:hypothetical protein
MQMELWIFWSVALSVALFFLIRFFSRRFGDQYHRKAIHLVILTHNSQQSVEWMIRSYHFWNGNKGRRGKITCIDTGSTDDTLKILERLEQRYTQLEIIRMHPHVESDEMIKEWLEEWQKQKEKLIVLDLREPENRKESERNLA